MKVIAKIATDRVLCEVSANEIARLMGSRSSYDKSFNNNWMVVGNELQIIPGFDALDALRALDPEQFQRTSVDLERLLQAFVNARDAFQGLMLMDTLKTAGNKE
jgi:hypothetical protein